MKQYTSIFAIVLSAGLGVLPFALLWALHGSYHVAPQFMDDSVYYYARLQAVAHGYWFIGNPYFLEHAQEIAAAFFGADWLAALPLLFGVPLLPAIILNAALWMALFCAACMWMYAKLGIAKVPSAVFATATVFALFWFLERPVAMQVVYPSFVFFLATLAAWLMKPSRRNSVLLSFSAALTFYLYTYEWQITVIVFALIHLLLFRSWRQYQSLLYIDAGIALLALPFVIYTVHQISHPYYWETVARIGLIETHTFGSAAVLVALQLLIPALGLWCIREQIAPPLQKFFVITGAAIFIAAFSNVITGKDLETGVHIARFAAAWAVIAGLLLLYRAWPPPLRASRPLAAFLLGLAGFASAFLPTLLTSQALSAKALKGERYDPVFSWLNANTAQGSVVFTDDAMSYYIPAETSDYVLFQPDGGLYLMSDAEVEDRYIASRLFATSSLAQIEYDYRLYSGVGHAVHSYKTHNRGVALCRLVEKDCGPFISSAVQYRGDAYFVSLTERALSMRSDPLGTLRRFHVRYIILPESQILPKEVKKATTASAAIGGYQIYELTP